METSVAAEKDNPPPPPAPITDAEKDAAFAPPATYVDTWFLSTWTGHVRIAVGEVSRREKAPDLYRLAFVMERDDARRFIEELTEALDMLEKREAALAKEK
jgi:hypothetical protein